MLAVADWAPSVDTSETDTAYLVKAEIPGVNRENVRVTIQDGMLTLQGERKQEKEDKGKKFHRIERCYGSFARSFRVPDHADEPRKSACPRKTRKTRTNSKGFMLPINTPWVSRQVNATYCFISCLSCFSWMNCRF
ncbi:MAG: Hsp20/alpha crystallin family protein [Gallionella sp.]|nr:Hsp20/alpha crystallin family protein [Gallionella sp.]